MSGGDESDDGKQSSQEFRDALGDVRAIAVRKKTVIAARRQAVRKRADESPVEFVRPDPHEARLGHVDGIDRRTLASLRSGRPAPEHTLDLHGLTEAEARDALRETLRACVARGERRLLVVHGRGLHSRGEPVLRAALPSWLAEREVGEQVLAFAPAASYDGGAGATAILLRRTDRSAGGGSRAR